MRELDKHSSLEKIVLCEIDEVRYYLSLDYNLMFY